MQQPLRRDIRLVIRLPDSQEPIKVVRPTVNDLGIRLGLIGSPGDRFVLEIYLSQFESEVILFFVSCRLTTSTVQNLSRSRNRLKQVINANARKPKFLKAEILEIRTLVESSKRSFASNQKLGALIEAIKAQKKLRQLGGADDDTKIQVESALGQAVYGVQEYNRLSGHEGGVRRYPSAGRQKTSAFSGRVHLRLSRFALTDGMVVNFLCRAGDSAMRGSETLQE